LIPRLFAWDTIIACCQDCYQLQTKGLITVIGTVFLTMGINGFLELSYYTILLSSYDKNDFCHHSPSMTNGWNTALYDVERNHADIMQ